MNGNDSEDELQSETARFGELFDNLSRNCHMLGLCLNMLRSRSPSVLECFGGLDFDLFSQSLRNMFDYMERLFPSLYVNTSVFCLSSLCVEEDELNVLLSDLESLLEDLSVYWNKKKF